VKIFGFEDLKICNACHEVVEPAETPKGEDVRICGLRI
jgi:hypothetical protein